MSTFEIAFWEVLFSAAAFLFKIDSLGAVDQEGLGWTQCQLHSVLIGFQTKNIFPSYNNHNIGR